MPKITIRLPTIIKAEIEECVYNGVIWKSTSDFVRDAINRYLKQFENKYVDEI